MWYYLEFLRLSPTLNFNGLFLYCSFRGFSTVGAISWRTMTRICSFKYRLDGASLGLIILFKWMLFWELLCHGLPDGACVTLWRPVATRAMSDKWRPASIEDRPEIFTIDDHAEGRTGWATTFSLQTSAPLACTLNTAPDTCHTTTCCHKL